mgnify:CR=1 FL=1
MPLEYPIPLSSKNAFEGLPSSVKRNPGLVFDRFVPDTQEIRREADNRNREEPAKKTGLKNVEKAARQADLELLKAWSARWQETVKRDYAAPFSLSTQWRLIAGLGRKGALEVGFTFNRYGFPYLPGSSVKGLARAAALAQLAEALAEEKLKLLAEAVSKTEKKAVVGLDALNLALSREELKDFQSEFEACGPDENQRQAAQDFRLVFGTTAQAGRAVFFDAIPIGKDLPVLELDIMNPHYPKYYEGSAPPTDAQNPIPVYFLAVKASTKFWFAVGWRDADNPVMRSKVEEMLKFGLRELGAGAKTSAGYGYFK